MVQPGGGSGLEGVSSPEGGLVQKGGGGVMHDHNDKTHMTSIRPSRLTTVLGLQMRRFVSVAKHTKSFPKKKHKLFRQPTQMSSKVLRENGEKRQQNAAKVEIQINN